MARNMGAWQPGGAQNMGAWEGDSSTPLVPPSPPRRPIYGGTYTITTSERVLVKRMIRTLTRIT